MVDDDKEEGEWVESWVFKEGDWVRDDQWMTKAQLQSFANKIETEDAIRAGARPKPAR
jgi:hypothetical protein